MILGTESLNHDRGTGRRARLTARPDAGSREEAARRVQPEGCAAEQPLVLLLQGLVHNTAVHGGRELGCAETIPDGHEVCVHASPHLCPCTYPYAFLYACFVLDPQKHVWTHTSCTCLHTSTRMSSHMLNQIYVPTSLCASLNLLSRQMPQDHVPHRRQASAFPFVKFIGNYRPVQPLDGRVVLINGVEKAAEKNHV